MLDAALLGLLDTGPDELDAGGAEGAGLLLVLVREEEDPDVGLDGVDVVSCDTVTETGSVGYVLLV